jgi:1,4-dihydroxy-2-naphthoate octaprenyltransferase
MLSLVATLVFFLMIKVGLGVENSKSSTETDPYLKQMALSTLLWVILFGIGLVFLGKS